MPAATAPSALRAAPPGESVHRLRIAMGTWAAIEARAAPAVSALRAIEAAFAAIAELELRMHPQRPGSDLERIAAAQPGSSTPVHADTLRVLQFAQRLCELTEGVFDPCLPVRPGRLSDLELYAGPPGPQVVCRAPVALDCGGLAKGFAIDCAVGALRRAGCSSGLVNLGGDLRLFGTASTTILLRHPDGGCQPLELANVALAASDRDASRRPQEHRGYYARVAVRTPPCRFAAVLADEAMVADALTKCVLLCPEKLAHRALQTLGGRSLT
jgi:FAD:protein FMN transferase